MARILATLLVIIGVAISANSALESQQPEVIPNEVPQGKLFFRYPWIPLPNLPTRAPAGAAANATVPAVACSTTANTGTCLCGTAACPTPATQACTLSTMMCATACPAAGQTAAGVCTCGAAAMCACGVAPTMCTRGQVCTVTGTAGMCA